MTTVYDGPGVVNPVPAQLGTGVLDLYDWLRLRHRPGRMRRVGELTPPGAPRYEQLTERLRKRIFDGTWPEGEASGPYFGREYNVSQPIVQRAFEALERDGLVLLESGRRTSVLPRRRWLVKFTALLPDDGGEAVGHAEGSLARTEMPPGLSDALLAGTGAATVLWVTAESADPFGAISLASPFGKLILAGLPIEAVNARPA